MTHNEKVKTLIAALGTVGVVFQSEEVYVSIIAMVDLIEKKKKETTIEDCIKENNLALKRYRNKKSVKPKGESNHPSHTTS